MGERRGKAVERLESPVGLGLLLLLGWERKEGMKCKGKVQDALQDWANYPAKESSLFYSPASSRNRKLNHSLPLHSHGLLERGNKKAFPVFGN